MKTLEIADRTLAAGSPPLIVAEVGSNHDGSLERALELVAAAAAAGAEAVKFQTYAAERLVRPGHELHRFFCEYALPREWHERLRDAAAAAGLLFLSTPFDPQAADFLAALGVPALKIASADLTNLPLLRRCARHGLPLLLSTGMATTEEVEMAVAEARAASCRALALLHCVSLYPTPPEKSELSAIPALAERFGLPVGFSDHSLSATLPAAAVALGACLVEKHFTLSRSLPGPDHAVALEPHEFAAMAAACRETAAALGPQVAAVGAGESPKRITPELEEVRRASLRGLYAAADIPAGRILEEGMVALLRPAGRLGVDELPRLLDRPATRDIRFGEELMPDMFGGAKR